MNFRLGLKKILISRFGKFFHLMPPFAVCLYLFRSFYPEKFLSYTDGWQAYNHASFYVHNMVRGVYPMWNPFFSLGRPNGLSLRVIGEFNPFLYLIAALNWLGLPFALSYCVFIVAYFFLGLAGFYFLAERLLKSTADAYFAFLLLLFSSMGGIVFSDPVVILMFVPGVWFFYFITAFAQEQNRFFFLGIVFTAMVLAITYMPYYFLTVFLVSAGSVFVLFHHGVIVLMKNTLKFIQGHKKFFICCLLLVCLSLTPGLMWYFATQTGDFYAMGHPLRNPSGALEKSAIWSSDLGGMVDFSNVLGGLDNAAVNLLFVPVMAYLVLWLSVVAPLRKQTIFFLMLFSAFFLITCGRHSPVHGFLYDHIGYFRHFRNLHFFIWLGIIPSFVLLCAGHFSWLIKERLWGKRKLCVWVGFLMIMHCLFAGFLYGRGNAGVTAFVATGLSFLFLAVGSVKKSFFAAPFVFIFLFFAVILQPMQVFLFAEQHRNKPEIAFQENSRVFDPAFSFQRPKFRDPRGARNESFMRDMSGLEHKRKKSDIYWGSVWVYLLGENIDVQVLEKYIRHKFLLYDRVAVLPGETAGDFRMLERAMNTLKNVAFISGSGADAFSDGDKIIMEPEALNQKKKKAQKIIGNSDKFAVLDFNANAIRLKTKLNSRKFLVYNDSFYPGWRAFINGKQVRLWRANFAFKGLWIPEGENVIEFRFGSLYFSVLGYFLSGVYIAVFFWFVREGFKCREA